MTDREKLLKSLKKLPDETISKLLDDVAQLLPGEEDHLVPACPYCGSTDVIRYGHRCGCGKQRFFCKTCGRTFVTTTHTIMSQSHSPADIWKNAISDTVHGHSIGYTAARLNLNHQTVFNMRHKILLTLQQLPEFAYVQVYSVEAVPMRRQLTGQNQMQKN